MIIAHYFTHWIFFGWVIATIFAADQLREDQVHFRQGKALFEAHDDTGEALEEAQREFTRALQLNPRLAEAVAYLGFIAAERNQYETALESYRRALQLDSHSPEAHVGLARISQHNGNHKEALDYLRKAVAGGPKNPLALRELAAALSNEMAQPTVPMWQEAIGCWLTLIGLDRDDRDAHYDLGGAYRRFGKWHEAELEFREVLRIGQTSEDSDVWVYSVHREVAEMLEKQVKYPEAIQEYRALINSEGAGDYEIGNAKARIAVLERSLKSR